MDFSQALELLKGKQKLTRTGWNGKGMFVQMQTPDDASKMRRPYLFLSPIDGEFVPWVASQTDLLASDWEIFVPEEPAPGV